MHDGIITKIRFFNEKDSSFIGAVVPMLNPRKSLQHHFIFKKHNHSHMMFFITKGRISFIIEKRLLPFKDMLEGGYFGEIDIIFKRTRSYTTRSAVDTDFLTLSKTLFEEVIV